MKEILQTMVIGLNGKKRYILILTQAVYSFLQAFNIITTTANQDIAFTVLVLALLGLEIKSKK